MEILKEMPTKNEWSNLIAKEGGICHTLEWSNVIREGLGYSPEFYLIREGTKLIGGHIAYHSNRKISCIKLKELTSFCEPILPTDNSEFYLNELVSFILTDTKKNKIRIIKFTGSPFWDNSDIFGEKGFKLIPKWHFVLNINKFKSSDDLLLKLDKDDRWCIRKGLKFGEICESKDIKDLEEHYNLYLKVRAVIGVKPYPYSYFKALFEHLVLKDLAKFMLIKYKNVIGGALLSTTFNKVISDYSISSDYSLLRYYPNDTLKWMMIQWAFENKYNYYDFTGVVPNAPIGTKQYDIYKYKKKWGGELKQYHAYLKYPLSNLTGAFK